MPNLTLKWKIIIFLLLGGVLIFFFQTTYNNKPKAETTPVTPTSPPNSVSPNNPPQIISTKPDPLEDNIISSAEEIDITFNRSLQNSAEFRVRMEPETDLKVELSGDRKTARIIPSKPYPLGTTFTLFISPETKFDGVGSWGQEKVFHFRTIKYTGV